MESIFVHKQESVCACVKTIPYFWLLFINIELYVNHADHPLRELRQIEYRRIAVKANRMKLITILYQHNAYPANQFSDSTKTLIFLNFIIVLHCFIDQLKKLNDL